MTRTDYAWGMSATPSDPPRINTKALDTFMHAFDHAFRGKYLGSVQPQTADTQAESMLRELERQVVKTVMVREREVAVQQQEQARLRFWHTLPLLRNIFRFRDDIRLRRYNREWLKNNQHRFL